MLKMLIDTHSFSVEHDPAARCLCATWRGHHNPAETVKRCGQLLQQVQLTRARWLLNDSSQSLDGWFEIKGWVGLDYFPRLADHGIQAVAWVNAHDWPARAHMAQMLYLVRRPLVDTFDDVEAAHSWLYALPAAAGRPR